MRSTTQNNTNDGEYVDTKKSSKKIEQNEDWAAENQVP